MILLVRGQVGLLACLWQHKLPWIVRVSRNPFEKQAKNNKLNTKITVAMHKLLHGVLLSCPPLSCAQAPVCCYTYLTVLDNQMLAVIGKKDMLPCKNYAAYFDRFFAAGKLLSSVLNCRCYNYLRTVSLDKCVAYPIDTALLWFALQHASLGLQCVWYQIIFC